MVVERDADEQCAYEGSWRSKSVEQSGKQPSHLSTQLDHWKLELGEGRTRLGVQYARMVCSQLIQTPLKEKSTPPSLSLYPDRAIVGGWH